MLITACGSSILNSRYQGKKISIQGNNLQPRGIQQEEQDNKGSLYNETILLIFKIYTNSLLAMFDQKRHNTFLTGTLKVAHHFPVLVDFERRHGRDPASSSGFFALVNVYLEKKNISIFATELLEHRRYHLARTTPGGCEINNHRFATLTLGHDSLPLRVILQMNWF